MEPPAGACCDLGPAGTDGRGHLVWHRPRRGSRRRFARVPGRQPRPALTPPASGRIPVAFPISKDAVLIDLAGPWEVFSNASMVGADGSMDMSGRGRVPGRAHGRRDPRSGRDVRRHEDHPDPQLRGRPGPQTSRDSRPGRRRRGDGPLDRRGGEDHRRDDVDLHRRVHPGQDRSAIRKGGDDPPRGLLGTGHEVLPGHQGEARLSLRR